MAERQQDKEHGEGNYKASRQYDEATKRFVDSGRVEDAARRANPETPEEAKEMSEAEQEGKRRAKGEDPALHSGTAPQRPGKSGQQPA